MENNTKRLYKNLKILRKIQGKSQTNVSEYIGFNLSSSLAHVEEGKRSITITKLLKWLNALGLNLNNIISDSQKGIDFKLLSKILKSKKNVKSINDFMKGKLNE